VANDRAAIGLGVAVTDSMAVVVGAHGDKFTCLSRAEFTGIIVCCCVVYMLRDRNKCPNNHATHYELKSRFPEPKEVIKACLEQNWQVNQKANKLTTPVQQPLDRQAQ
jgi:hypothetical protein